MKNEAIARAITEIDDELISSARSDAPRRRVNGRIYGVCAAACLMLICCLTLALRSGKIKISVYGQDIAKNSVVTVPENGDAASTRRYDREGICIPITVKTNADFTIKVSYGELELVTDDGTLTEKYSRALNVSGSADMIWSVEQPDKEQTYTFEINGEEALRLSYDRTSSSWQIAKNN